MHGAPELVVEIAKATRYVDLGPKLNEYERAGVLEYVVHAIDPDEIYWFGQEQGARPVVDRAGRAFSLERVSGPLARPASAPHG